MLTTFYHLAGAFIFAYFARTLVLAFPLSMRSTRNIATVHLLAFALIAAAVIAIRLPLGVFSAPQLLPYIAAQIFWFLFDAAVKKTMRARRSAGG